jgi:hypothetical protein
VIKSRRVKWAGHLAHMEKMINLHKLLVRKLKAKRLFGGCKCRRKDNIKMYLMENGGRGKLDLSDRD